MRSTRGLVLTSLLMVPYILLCAVGAFFFARNEGVTADGLRTIGAVAALGALALSAGSAFMLRRGYFLPLRSLTLDVRRAAGGDLAAAELHFKCGGELFELGEEIGVLLQRYREEVSPIREAVRSASRSAMDVCGKLQEASELIPVLVGALREVTDSVSEQAQGARTVTATVTQVYGGLSQISSGAGELTSSALTVTQAMDEMGSSVEDADRKARNLAVAVSEAERTAVEGLSVVEATISGMVVVQESVMAAVDRLSDLRHLSNKIGEITQAITGIAEQTNLLALNAAIEAARAGANGRGFAVVADEIRKLSERSQASARQISELIPRVQEKVEQAAQAVQLSAAEADRGATRSASAIDALRAIMSAIQKTPQDVEAITAVTNRVLSLSKAVLQSASSVSAVAEENSAATEEISASAEVVTRAVERQVALTMQNEASICVVFEGLSGITAPIERSSAMLRDVAQRLEPPTDAGCAAAVANPSPLQ